MVGATSSQKVLAARGTLGGGGGASPVVRPSFRRTARDLRLQRDENRRIPVSNGVTGTDRHRQRRRLHARELRTVPCFRNE